MPVFNMLEAKSNLSRHVDAVESGVETLPPIHSDPFDRLLVAQAMTVPLRLVTHDQTVAAYSDSTIVA